LNYLGMFLIIWANTYDSADGQLARLTGKYSQIGRILDGLSGDLWFFAIYFTLVFREFNFGDLVAGNYFCYGQGHNWLLWTLAWGAGICHAKQASSADYYRQFHLYFLKGKEGSELESTEALTEQFKQLSWSKNFMKKLTLAFYRNYTKSQEALTPAMQRLRKLLKERYGEELPQQLRDDFRAASLPLMKYTNMLSFNTRIITMFIAVAVRTPWLYFVFELVVLNAMMVYMIVRHERICKSFISSIENGKY
ncbi:MAG: CDP-alcohol phosphatidyltransferase family protein, partial [Muribaculaceae bacterium]|nr:CDP-alcohol phosphatidyltransferase family protein [Muribaculaceae bacterium]